MNKKSTSKIKSSTQPEAFYFNEGQNVAIEGFREHMVSGLKHGCVNFVKIPGEYKRKRVYYKDNGIKKWRLSERKFYPDERYPNGIFYSFPAWFILLIGIPAFFMLLKALGVVFPSFDWGDKVAWAPGKFATDLQRNLLGIGETKPYTEDEMAHDCRIFYDMGTRLKDIPHPALRVNCKPYYEKWAKEDAEAQE